MSEAGGQEPVASPAVAAGARMGDGSPAQQRRGERLRLIARILGTVGPVLFAVGAWMPWVVASVYTFVGDQRHDYTLTLSAGDVDGVFGNFAWSAVTVLGVVLLPLLWWRSQPFIAYGVLRLNPLLILFTGLELSPGFSRGAYLRLVPELYDGGVIIVQPGPWLLGFWVANAGIVLMFVAGILAILLRSELRTEWRLLREGARSASASSRPRVLLPGASTLTIGVALWAVSTFVMPWASVDCTSTPLFFGRCTGLSYSSVLRIGIADATNVIDPLVAHYAVGVLLAGDAAMVLAGLWWRARSVAFCGWATLWVMVAAGFAWLAEDGVGVVVERHEALGLQAGTWVGENAVLVTLLGFILALVGLGYLWVDAVRHRHADAGA